MKKITVVVAAMVTGWMFNAVAADDGGQQGPGGPGGERGMHRPPPPIVKVLDANGDGVIDAGEIANAAAALKALDKNGDGKLTRDEFMPPRPPRSGDQQGARGEGEGRRGDGERNGPPPHDGENK